MNPTARIRLGLDINVSEKYNNIVLKYRKEYNQISADGSVASKAWPFIEGADLSGLIRSHALHLSPKGTVNDSIY